MINELMQLGLTLLLAGKVGQEANPQNILLMPAVGPNVAVVIGSAIAAGIMIMLIS